MIRLTSFYFVFSIVLKRLVAVEIDRLCNVLFQQLMNDVIMSSISLDPPQYRFESSSYMPSPECIKDSKYDPFKILENMSEGERNDYVRTDILKRIIVKREIRIGTYEMDLGNMGVYSVNPPVGFFPELMRSILKQFSERLKKAKLIKGGPDIKPRYVFYADIESLTVGLHKQDIEMSDLYFLANGLSQAPFQANRDPEHLFPRTNYSVRLCGLLNIPLIGYMLKKDKHFDFVGGDRDEIKRLLQSPHFEYATLTEANSHLLKEGFHLYNDDMVSGFVIDRLDNFWKKFSSGHPFTMGFLSQYREDPSEEDWFHFNTEVFGVHGPFVG